MNRLICDTLNAIAFRFKQSLLASALFFLGCCLQVPSLSFSFFPSLLLSTSGLQKARSDEPTGWLDTSMRASPTVQCAASDQTAGGCARRRSSSLRTQGSDQRGRQRQHLPRLGEASRKPRQGVWFIPPVEVRFARGRGR